MKKKLLSFLTLALCACSAAWASTVDDLETISSNYTFTASTINSGTPLSENTLYDSNRILSVGGNGYNNGYQVKNNRQIAFKVSRACTVTINFNTNSDRKMQLGTTATGTDYCQTEVSPAVCNVSAAGVLYINASSDLYVTGFTIDFPATDAPTITSQPVGAAYEEGADMDALSVTATASDDGDLYYQWYSCDDAEKTNSSEIDGATNSSYTPTAFGFYYCTVTDGNGSVDSDVVEIAEATTTVETPTFRVINGTVEILCATEDATIKFSTDGENYNTYTVPQTYFNNTTIYAKAQKAGCATSAIASQAVTAAPAAASGSSSITIFADIANITKSPSTGSGTKYDIFTGNAGTYLDGYVISLDNEDKDFKELSTGNSINGKTTLKGSNGRTITIKLPNGIVVNRLTLYSYTNGSSSDIRTTWTINGTAYTTETMIGLSYKSDYGKNPANSNSDPDVRVFAIDNATGSITINNAGYQQCFYAVLDYTVELGTIASRNFGTCVTPPVKLDFSSAEGITAYIATGLNGAGDAVLLQEVDVVPAGTPIIVETATQGATVNVPVTTADADDVSDNKLVAGDGTTAWNGTAGTTYYFIKQDEFHQATSGTLQSGKAYLAVTSGSSAPWLRIGFVEEETGINEVNATEANAEGYYNLAGQRVANPTKGLYIVNGKKVIIK